MPNQNPELALSKSETDNMTPIFRTGRRNLDTVHWVFEVNPETFKKTVGKKVFCGYTRCKVAEYARISQCYRCQGYGHIANKCRATAAVCKHCAGSHNSQECKDLEKAKCANCDGPYKASHLACPRREQILRSVLRRTDYGDSAQK